MDGNNENNGSAGETPTPPVVSPFDWKIWVLGIYLFILLIISVYFLAVLMLADTTDTDKNGNTLAACKKNANSENTVSNSNKNTNAAAANTNTNSSTANSTNGISSVDNISNTGNTGNINGKSDTNTSRTTGDTEVNKNSTVTPTETPKPTPTPSLTPTPSPTPKEDIDPTVPKIVKIEGLSTFTSTGCLTGDGYVFLIVLFAGMVGAVIRGIYSFFLHLGRKDFGFNWIWFYILLPYFGGTLSLTLYFVIRGGFYSGSVGKALVINLFSFAALGALAGLFSDQALAKLQMVAESLLTKADPKTIEPVIAKIVIPSTLNLNTAAPIQNLTVTATDPTSKPIAGLAADSFQWISDNPAVATVNNNGVVTRVTPGTCNVTAAAKSNAVVSNKCVVTCS